VCNDARGPQKCFWRPNAVCATSQTSRGSTASSSPPFEFVGVFHTRGLTCKQSPKLYFVGFFNEFCTEDLTRDGPNAHALQPQVSPLLNTEPHSEAYLPNVSGIEDYSGHFMRFRCRFPKFEANLNVNTLFSHYKITARTQYAQETLVKKQHRGLRLQR
jgi:hypothetical protein